MIRRTIGRGLRVVLVTLPMALVSAGAAEAATSWHVGARVGGFEASQASDTWDAVYGDTMTQYGVQVELRFHDPSWFVALAVDRGSVDGEAVAPLPGGGTVPTGTETELTMTPIHLTVGGIALADRAWQVYYGGGLTRLEWEDENILDPVDTTDDGFHALVGLRHERGRVGFAGEARWSTIPDAIGEGGASEFFGEDDWGGLSAHLVLSFRLGR